MKRFFCYILLLVWWMDQSSLRADPVERVFTKIYEEEAWGKEARSGSGSTLEATLLYRTFLEHLLKEFNIRSVVDVGCGDWEFSRAIDWGSIRYIGYDVVKPIIEMNQKWFGTARISFIHGNGIQSDLPEADLLICKEVLQHLPNRDIHQFLKQLRKFKYCLITNDVDPVTLTSQNRDIPYGHYRPIDLTAPPFSIKGIKVLMYTLDHVQYLETKEVLLIEKG